ncbi:hypothetical protein [Mycoplasma seminis]|uniref:Uncharacterized protein n=1 Tax=Mycoplasma seminis TaxID=512749 RepID=A0ABY9HAM1_9MOLU|nr:hypothetical protein [Mycoplasma seminis]WLP85244.1 hypothetical protein Q8852_02890 [Mycoplasma seminis]
MEKNKELLFLESIGLTFEEFKKSPFNTQNPFKVPNKLKKLMSEADDAEAFQSVLFSVYNAANALINNVINILLMKLEWNTEKFTETVGRDRVELLKKSLFHEVNYRFTNTTFPELANRSSIYANNTQILGSGRDFFFAEQQLNPVSYKFLEDGEWNLVDVEFGASIEKFIQLQENLSSIISQTVSEIEKTSKNLFNDLEHKSNKLINDMNSEASSQIWNWRNKTMIAIDDIAHDITGKAISNIELSRDNALGMLETNFKRMKNNSDVDIEYVLNKAKQSLKEAIEDAKKDLETKIGNVPTVLNQLDEIKTKIESFATIKNTISKTQLDTAIQNVEGKIPTDTISKTQLDTAIQNVEGKIPTDTISKAQLDTAIQNVEGKIPTDIISKTQLDTAIQNVEGKIPTDTISKAQLDTAIQNVEGKIPTDIISKTQLDTAIQNVEGKIPTDTISKTQLDTAIQNVRYSIPTGVVRDWELEGAVKENLDKAIGRPRKTNFVLVGADEVSKVIKNEVTDYQWEHVFDSGSPDFKSKYHYIMLDNSSPYISTPDAKNTSLVSIESAYDDPLLLEKFISSLDLEFSDGEDFLGSDEVLVKLWYKNTVSMYLADNEALFNKKFNIRTLGTVTIEKEPEKDLDAVNKKYVDDSISTVKNSINESKSNVETWKQEYNSEIARLRQIVYDIQEADKNSGGGRKSFEIVKKFKHFSSKEIMDDFYQADNITIDFMKILDEDGINFVENVSSLAFHFSFKSEKTDWGFPLIQGEVEIPFPMDMKEAEKTYEESGENSFQKMFNVIKKTEKNGFENAIYQIMLEPVQTDTGAQMKVMIDPMNNDQEFYNLTLTIKGTLK